MNWTQLIQPFQNHSTAMYCQFINPCQLSTSQSSYSAYRDHVLKVHQLCHYTLIHQAQLAPIGICHANQWLIQCQSYTNPRTVAQVTGELVYYGDQLLVSTEDDWGHQSVYISNRETTLHISHSADNTNFIGDRLTQVTPIPDQSEDSFASNRGTSVLWGPDWSVSTGVKYTNRT